MDFDSALADAEFVRDDLVRLAGDHEVENLALAVGQATESLRNFGMRLLFLPPL